MSTSYFPHIDRWRIPAAVFAASLAEMARDGAEGNEGVALWLGTREGGEARVTHAVALRGLGVVRLPDHLSLPAAALNEVADVTIALGVTLLGQIHSHGPGYGVDLSRIDHVGGIRVPWFLSAVAPDYALRPTTRIEDCGVHVFEPDRGYRRLPARELATRVVITDDDAPAIILVGEEVTP